MLVNKIEPARGAPARERTRARACTKLVRRCVAPRPAERAGQSSWDETCVILVTAFIAISTARSALLPQDIPAKSATRVRGRAAGWGFSRDEREETGARAANAHELRPGSRTFRNRQTEGGGWQWLQQEVAVAEAEAGATCRGRRVVVLVL